VPNMNTSICSIVMLLMDSLEKTESHPKIRFGSP
jgi:hypothetical protein